MKIKKLKFIMLAGVATIITLIACTKGNIGPAGPAGAAGAANVRVYHWNSKTTSKGPDQLIEYILPNERYSQIDSIEWHFYVADNTGTWFPLPGTFNSDNDDYFRVYTFNTGTNILSFHIEHVPNLSFDPTKKTAITFSQAKAVIVPAGSFTNLRTNINWNDYNDVKQKLHLKEEDEILVK